MKKIVFILSICLICLCGVSCHKDWNDEEDLLSREYEQLSFIDYKGLPQSSFPAQNGYFTPENAPKVFLENWLNKTRPDATIGENLLVSYYYMGYDHPDSLTNLSVGGMIPLRTSDYKAVWGNLFVEAFTPAKRAEAEIPFLLSNNFPNAEEGEYKIVSYNESEEEPTLEYLDRAVYSEDFTGIAQQSFGAKVVLPRHFNGLASATGRFWGAYTRDANLGPAMYLNYNSHTGGDSWFVLEELDLASVQNIILSFDLGLGYSRPGGVKEYLRVKITESFDGQKPQNSNWTDITTALGVYNVLKEQSYPGARTKLQIDLSHYTGKKIYIAFQAALPIQATNYSITEYYVIDNIKVSGKLEQFSVSEAKPKYKVFKYNAGEWNALNDVYVLQPEDYQSLGKDFLDADEAHRLVPAILAAKVTGGVEGDTKAVVYKLDNVLLYAENYLYKNGKWEFLSRPSLEKRTSKFKYTYPAKKWQGID